MSIPIQHVIQNLEIHKNATQQNFLNNTLEFRLGVRILATAIANFNGYLTRISYLP